MVGSEPEYEMTILPSSEFSGWSVWGVAELMEAVAIAVQLDEPAYEYWLMGQFVQEQTPALEYVSTPQFEQSS